MWSLDRRVAASAVAVALAALAIPIAASDAPAPRRPGADPVVLARELAALANRGTRASWIVTYGFTRFTTAGGRLHDTVVVAHLRTPNGSSLDIDNGLGSLVVTAGDRTFSCTVPVNAPECLERPATGRTSEPGAVYGGAVIGGRYDISRLAARRIAGIAAQCFQLRVRKGAPVPGIGFSSEQCYSSDGIPVRSLVQGSTATDVRVAVTVRRDVGRGDVLPILTQYGLQRLAPAD